MKFNVRCVRREKGKIVEFICVDKDGIDFPAMNRNVLIDFIINKGHEFFIGDPSARIDIYLSTSPDKTERNNLKNIGECFD